LWKLEIAEHQVHLTPSRARCVRAPGQSKGSSHQSRRPRPTPHRVGFCCDAAAHPA